MPIPIVSTEGRRPERRDLLSPISYLSLKQGLSTPRFALRSRRRKGTTYDSPAGFTLTSLSTEAVEKGCPVSKVLNAEITLTKIFK